MKTNNSTVLTERQHTSSYAEILWQNHSTKLTTVNVLEHSF